MTLDLYCEELKIAIEYNGVQHYKYIPHFHRNDPEQFEAHKRRQKNKLELCAKNGVYVITVPYTVDVEDIEKYLQLCSPFGLVKTYSKL